MSASQEAGTMLNQRIAALQIIYGQPYARGRLTFQQVKELAARLQEPPQGWTPDRLWLAYAHNAAPWCVTP